MLLELTAETLLLLHAVRAVRFARHDAPQRAQRGLVDECRQVSADKAMGRGGELLLLRWRQAVADAGKTGLRDQSGRSGGACRSAKPRPDTEHWLLSSQA